MTKWASEKLDGRFWKTNGRKSELLTLNCLLTQIANEAMTRRQLSALRREDALTCREDDMSELETTERKEEDR